jgi:GT2 family glycosyltransferase
VLRRLAGRAHVSALRAAVVIVNYNSGAQLHGCLTALTTQTLPCRVLVVDNASHDGSARRAHAAFPEVAWAPLRRNVGFARAVNLAAERLADAADVLVTLNPDTVPEPDFLEQLLIPLRVDARVGAVAGTLVFATRPDIIASAGIVVHRNGVALDARLGESRPAPGAAPEPVFGASAGAAAYRLDAFRAAGGLPEAFFMYLDDVDLAWRLRGQGWRAVWAPGAVATHAYSASAGEGSPFKRRLLARNRIWTLARCLPGEAWTRDWRSIIGFDVLACLASVARGDWAAVRGRAEGLCGLPLRLVERTKIVPRACHSERWSALEPWIAPPVSWRQLLKLRRLTARLAEAADRTAER